MSEIEQLAAGKNEEIKRQGFELEAFMRRIVELEAELALRPTTWAYVQACKALHHWRDEARRLGDIAGVEPRPMDQQK